MPAEINKIHGIFLSVPLHPADPSRVQITMPGSKLHTPAFLSSPAHYPKSPVINDNPDFAETGSYDPKTLRSVPDDSSHTPRTAEMTV